MRQFENHNMQQLNDIIAESLNNTADDFERTCHALSAIRRLGEYHRLMRAPGYKRFQDVADHRLSAHAVLTLQIDGILRRLCGLPLEFQNRVANGQPIRMAEWTAKGEIVEVDKPILQMDEAALDRVFVKGKVATVSEQKAALQSQAAPKPKSKTPSKARLRADVKSRCLVIGNNWFSLEDLRSVLAQLGARLIIEDIASAPEGIDA